MEERGGNGEKVLSFCIALLKHTHARRLHRPPLCVVRQARNLSAALRVGTGAEERLADCLLDAGRVGGRGGWTGGVGCGRVGWGIEQGGVGGWGGGLGGGRVGPGGGWGAGEPNRGAVVRSPKGYLYGGGKNALQNRLG